MISLYLAWTGSTRPQRLPREMKRIQWLIGETVSIFTFNISVIRSSRDSRLHFVSIWVVGPQTKSTEGRINCKNLFGRMLRIRFGPRKELLPHCKQFPMLVTVLLGFSKIMWRL